MKIDRILNVQDIRTKDGTELKKTEFLSGGSVYFTFAKVSEGEDREEVSRKENEFRGNKEITIKFAPKGGFGGGFGARGGSKSDPNTMLMAYAKDIAIAGLEAGIYKSIADTLKAFDVTTDVMVAKYNKIQSGESRGSKIEQPALVTDADYSGEPKSDASTEDEDMNLDELPF